MYFTVYGARTGHISRNFKEYSEQKSFEIIPSNAAIDWSVQSNANNPARIEKAGPEYIDMLMD
ncbi:MAG TPA: hypothetical protein VFH07_13880 [Chitinophagaceae bacterium]|jgi:hypothetical protein|nr:hypothetical protein [Chitinophagaceae bacterium]